MFRRRSTVPTSSSPGKPYIWVNNGINCDCLRLGFMLSAIINRLIWRIWWWPKLMKQRTVPALCRVINWMFYWMSRHKHPCSFRIVPANVPWCIIVLTAITSNASPAFMFPAKTVMITNHTSPNHFLSRRNWWRTRGMDWALLFRTWIYPIRKWIN